MQDIDTVLVRVNCPAAHRAGLIALSAGHGAHVIDVGTASLVFELTDARASVDAFLNVLKPLGIKETFMKSWKAQADGAGD